jgi:hypothetical protein
LALAASLKGASGWGKILRKYSMRPEDARVLSRYAVDDATQQEASAAFRESLRDPGWMMEWFERHQTELTPFIEWTRAPAVSVLKNVNELAAHAALMRQRDVAMGTTLSDTVLSSSKWATWQDELLVTIAARMAKGMLNEETESLTAPVIDEHCPGLSVGLRSLHSAWWTTMGHTPRKAKPRDFPDALHAMYAPYVELFRADSFMAPYIEKCAKQFGTVVVPRLVALPTAIRPALEARERGC